MKKCPLCNVEMGRVDYEGFQVNNCPQCGGHLLRRMAFEGIKRNPSTSDHDLAAEAAEFQGSTQQTLSCPSCLSIMSKRVAVGDPNVEYDLCGGCGAIWLDAGELAILQQAYENSPKGQSDAEMRRRAAERDADPERKAQFERDVAKCKEDDTTMGKAISGGIFSAFLNALTHGRTWRF